MNIQAAGNLYKSSPDVNTLIITAIVIKPERGTPNSWPQNILEGFSAAMGVGNCS